MIDITTSREPRKKLSEDVDLPENCTAVRIEPDFEDADFSAGQVVLLRCKLLDEKGNPTGIEMNAQLGCGEDFGNGSPPYLQLVFPDIFKGTRKLRVSVRVAGTADTPVGLRICAADSKGELPETKTPPPIDEALKSPGVALAIADYDHDAMVQQIAELTAEVARLQG